MNQYLNHRAQTGRIHDADDWGNNTTAGLQDFQRDSADFGSVHISSALVPMGYYEGDLGKNYLKAAVQSVQKQAKAAVKTVSRQSTAAVKTVQNAPKNAIKNVKAAAKGLKTDAKYLQKYAKTAGKDIQKAGKDLHEAGQDTLRAGRAVVGEGKNLVRSVAQEGTNLVRSVREEANRAGDAVGLELRNAGKGIARAPATIARGISEVAVEAGKSLSDVAKSGEKVINAGTDAISDVAYTAGKYAVSPFIAAGKLAEKAYVGTGLKDMIEGKKKKGGDDEQQGPTADEAAEIDRLNAEGVQNAGEDSEAQKFEEQTHTQQGEQIQNERGDYTTRDGERVEGASEFDKPAAVAKEAPYARAATRSEDEGVTYQSSGSAVAPTRFEDEGESSAFPEPVYMNDANSEFNQGGESYEMQGYAQGYGNMGRMYDPEAHALGAMIDDEMMSNQQLISKLLRRLADFISPEQKLAIAQQKVKIEAKQAELTAAKAELVRENGGINPLAKAQTMPLDTRRAYDDDVLLNDRFDQALLGYDNGYGVAKVQALGSYLDKLARHKVKIKNNPRKRKELDAVNKELVKRFGLLAGLYGQLGDDAQTATGSVVSKLVTDQVLGDPALKAKLNALALDAGNKATEAGRKALGDFVKKNKTTLIGAGAGTVFTIGLLAYALLKPRSVKLSIADVRKLNAKAGI